MSIKYLTPKSDFIFKKIFGDAKNVEILEAFLKSILDIPHDEYESLTLTDTHLKKENDEDKLGILDVKVQTKSGNTIDIEIQLANIPHIRERVVFYLSKMINEQISSGDKYNAIKRLTIKSQARSEKIVDWLDSKIRYEKRMLCGTLNESMSSES